MNRGKREREGEKEKRDFLCISRNLQSSSPSIDNWVQFTFFVLFRLLVLKLMCAWSTGCIAQWTTRRLESMFLMKKFVRVSRTAELTSSPSLLWLRINVRRVNRREMVTLLFIFPPQLTWLPEEDPSAINSTRSKTSQFSCQLSCISIVWSIWWATSVSFARISRRSDHILASSVALSFGGKTMIRLGQ